MTASNKKGFLLQLLRYVPFVPFCGNLRFGLRSLRKNPSFALVAIAILTLGIGATTAIFSVVNSVLLRPLPYKDPDQLVWIWSKRPTNNKAPFSVPDFLDHH